MVTLTVAGVDKTKFIKWKTLSINNILTRQVDTAKFVMTYKQRDGSVFTPINGSEVIISRDGTKIFGGLILRVTDRTDAFATKSFEIDCVDYTRLLDAKLISKDYANQTVNDIIADINTNFLSGFTIANVNCETVLTYISFRYATVSQALQQLADLTQFHWWVDYDKDIHFVSTGVEAAPVDIEDTTGTYDQDTLIIKKDNRNLKNVIYVRGGVYLGDTFTATFIADGSQNVFPLTYKYQEDDFKVTVTGAAWNIGQEPTDVPEIYDALWNNESRLVRFRTDRLPSNGSDIKVVGRRFLPVIAKVRDSAAIADTLSVEGGTGEHEFLIVDDSLVTKEAARERATAELLAYAKSITEGSFTSRTDGFKAGQEVRINSSNLGINSLFIISKVVTTMLTPTTPIYKIILISTRTFGIIDFFQRLINKQKIEIDINPNEIVDTVESVNDSLGLTETLTTSTEHNLISESISLTETTTAQSPDYAVEFVYHEQVPTGLKRGGSFDGAVFQ